MVPVRVGSPERDWEREKDMRTIDVQGVTGITFRAVWDREAGEVLFYDTRFSGDAERGERRQDMWTADGQFVGSYTSDVLAQHGDHGINLCGGVDAWALPAGSVATVRRWLRCGISGTYSTARENGMEFIGGRWVFAGDKGYRVRADGDTYRVVSYAGGLEQPTYLAGMTLDAAHDAAWRMSHGK
jgi:hypothetical protein